MEPYNSIYIFIFFLVYLYLITGRQMTLAEIATFPEVGAITG
jgi:hypothetical protein